MSDRNPDATDAMAVAWDPRDDIFVATVPDLPGRRTFGRIRAEAVQGEEAFELWIDDARADGDSIPPPRDVAPDPANRRSAAILGANA
ncbi:MAG: hypothetical protein AVDCRST_MAG73-3925 [uncultured Thermomicrobiales bacterium]|uniref:Uncharacterized protein n=1 Tax=uncultured Thermomicrobiales bacterium TaxID=1645740 RepID=A0A6J4V278_9BACT|nr:MAG: hypothetical protein AVDCRST_MAG73-3925 [uncultured Thermomicrobiales bacterium]